MYCRQCSGCGKYTYSNITMDVLRCAYCGIDITDQPLLPAASDEVDKEE